MFNLFARKQKPITSLTYADFWKWFQANQSDFHKILFKGKNVEQKFLNPVSEQLARVKEDLYLLAGKYDENTVEVIFTPDGIIKNIIFAEELVKNAPAIPGWKFTALKPASDIMGFYIHIGDYEFSDKNLFFYPNEYKEYPDEISITVVHQDYKNADKNTIINGVYLYLDNNLGELESVTTIDSLTIVPQSEAQAERIPIEKLKDYLAWRKKEFIEKYEGTHHDTTNDEYLGFEGTTPNNFPIIAILNQTLLKWNAKASHPWIAIMEFKYDGSERNGMPEPETTALMEEIQDSALAHLKDEDGYLYIGRETGNNNREVYWACKDFRKPSKVFYELYRFHLFFTQFSSQQLLENQ